MTDLGRHVPSGDDRAVEVGPGIVLRHYPEDGPETLASSWRIEHRCDRAHRNAGVIVCAVPLNPRHVIVKVDPLTVTASIVCVDCGLHGWVTDGVWRDA